jgi:hypothetical protein
MHTTTTSKTLWHRLLGKLLEELLTPVGISVYVEYPVMSQSPKADILLLQRDQRDWTEEQRQRLPDGIRDSHARHIIIEFKYTESLTVEAFQQSLAYDLFYKQSQRLDDSVVQTFLVCAKQSQADRLTHFGYVATTAPGVYQNQYPVLEKLILLSLNELANSPHNAFFKCFASQKAEKKKAFDLLMGEPLQFSLTRSLMNFIRGLWNYWFPLRGEEMNLEVTPEHIARLGKKWKKGLLGGLSVEDILEDLEETKLDRLLARLKPERRLAGLTLEEVLAYFNLQDIENHLQQSKKPQSSGPTTKSRRK